MKPGRVWPGIGTGAVVKREGCLLMVLRAGSHGADQWSVPGGWVEMWEDPAKGAEREALEETGVKVRAMASLGWTDAQHPNEGIHAVTLWVRCAYVSGDPSVVEPEKCPAVEWVPFSMVGRRPLFKPLESWWPRYMAKL